MPVLFSLCAALTWGAGDFFGGLSTRRAPALATAFLVQLTGLVLLLAWIPWRTDLPSGGAWLGWSALAGVSGGIAALTLYPALALGNACSVAPLSAVIGTALPILFGVLLGERPSPSAWAGIALAALTIVLVSADGRRSASDPARSRKALLLAALSGVFIGGFLIAFERAGATRGSLSLLVARATGVPLFALALAFTRTRPWPAGRAATQALTAGVLDIAANGCYLFALARAPLSIVVPLSNLYPAFTVIFGVLFLGDRPRAVQHLGLVLALGAIVLITR